MASGVFSTLATPAPYHLLLLGTLTGSTLYQSFFAGIVAFKALPRPSFSKLQERIFPGYFALQTIAPLLMYLTRPPQIKAWPFAVIGLSGLLNLTVIGPLTTKVIKQRREVEARDADSTEMKTLNRKFGQAHGASSLTNMVTLLSTLYYTLLLSQRLLV